MSDPDIRVETYFAIIRGDTFLGFEDTQAVAEQTAVEMMSKQRGSYSIVPTIAFIGISYDDLVKHIDEELSKRLLTEESGANSDGD